MPRRSAQDTKDFLALARARFAQAQAAEKEQKERELDDLRFAAGDQWPEDIRTARAGQNASNGLPPIPARPCLTIDKTADAVRQVLEQAQDLDLGIELVPADDFGELAQPIDDTEVELREGLIRRIQRSSEAEDARMWAFKRAAEAGRGYYGVMTRYVPGKTWDQDIFVQRFYNQNAVTLDPAHEQPDGSDVEWAFVGADMPFAEYQAQYPNIAREDGTQTPNVVAGVNSDDFRALGEQYPGWFNGEDGDTDTRACRVVDYYYTVRTSKTLCLLADGASAWQDELPEGAPVTDRRTVVEKAIKWAKIDGYQVLEETDWPGPDIPIVKILGEELQPYDSQRMARGIIRPARDSQQAFNAMVSKWVETVGYAPIPPWLIAEGTDEGYQQEYQLANTRALSVLHYKTTDLEGRPAPPPTVATREAPIQAIAASVQLFDEAIQSTTGVRSLNLRGVDANLRSGRALQEVVAQNQRGTSGYTDNLARSLRYEAQILNNLLYPIYGMRPGRIARIVNGQGETEHVQIGQPSSTGMPMPTMPGAPMPQPPMKALALTKDANFNIAVKISKSYDTRR